MANLNQLRREKGFCHPRPRRRSTVLRGRSGWTAQPASDQLCIEYSVAGCATTSGAFASPERGPLGRCREISNSRGAGSALLRPRGLQSLNTGDGTSVLEAVRYRSSHMDLRRPSMRFGRATLDEAKTEIAESRQLKPEVNSVSANPCLA